MAFLVKSNGRPFWLLRYRDTISGGWVQKSTGLKVNDRNDTRKARELRDRHIALEQAQKPTTPAEAWTCWVQQFLALRYGAPESSKTLSRYQTSWRSVAAYLESKQLRFPRQLSYEHIRDYFAWRKAPDHPAVGSCGHNTSIADVRILGLILDEAIRLNYAVSNPCRRIGIKKHAPKIKPEFSEQDIQLIRRALRTQPSWMRVSFEVAIRHGTRLRATSVSLSKDVDWDRETVTFHEKGHRTFTVPLHPDLLPLFHQLRDQGQEYTCIIPANASKRWMDFFKRIGKPEFCFHCCRVTVISRMARSGIPENQAQKFVGHASTEIHRRYQRHHSEDLLACHKVGCFPRVAIISIFVPPASYLGSFPLVVGEFVIIYDD